MTRKTPTLLALAAFAVAFGAVSPARAAESVSPTMSLTIKPGATAHTVCAKGTASATLYTSGNWTLAIDGTRTGAEPINVLQVSSGPAFSACATIPKLGAPAGEYHVNFLFAGVGSSVAGKMSGFGSWQPALPDIGLALPV